jgi:hypothetical protein
MTEPLTLGRIADRSYDCQPLSTSQLQAIGTRSALSQRRVSPQTEMPIQCEQRSGQREVKILQAQRCHPRRPETPMR